MTALYYYSLIPAAHLAFIAAAFPALVCLSCLIIKLIASPFVNVIQDKSRRKIKKNHEEDIYDAILKVAEQTAGQTKANSVVKSDRVDLPDSAQLPSNVTTRAGKVKIVDGVLSLDRIVEGDEKEDSLNSSDDESQDTQKGTDIYDAILKVEDPITEQATGTSAEVVESGDTRLKVVGTLILSDGLSKKPGSPITILTPPGTVEAQGEGFALGALAFLKQAAYQWSVGTALKTTAATVLAAWEAATTGPKTQKLEETDSPTTVVTIPSGEHDSKLPFDYNKVPKDVPVEKNNLVKERLLSHLESEKQSIQAQVYSQPKKDLATYSALAGTSAVISAVAAVPALVTLAALGERSGVAGRLSGGVDSPTTILLTPGDQAFPTDLLPINSTIEDPYQRGIGGAVVATKAIAGELAAPVYNRDALKLAPGKASVTGPKTQKANEVPEQAIDLAKERLLSHLESEEQSTQAKENNKLQKHLAIYNSAILLIQKNIRRHLHNVHEKFLRDLTTKFARDLTIYYASSEQILDQTSEYDRIIKATKSEQILAQASLLDLTEDAPLPASVTKRAAKKTPLLEVNRNVLKQNEGPKLDMKR